MRTATSRDGTPGAGWSPAEVRAWLAALPADQRPLVACLRRRIRAAAPAARESVYHAALGYGPTASGVDRILYVAVAAGQVTLGFFYGGALTDSAGLLVGSGKRMRHIELRGVDERAHPALAPLLEEAWADGLEQAAQRHHRGR